MALADDAVDELAQRYGRLVAVLARAQFARFIALVAEGEDVAKAFAQAQVGFSGGFADMLAQAFSLLLQRSVGTDEVRAMPIGGLTLSRRLYLHSRETAAEVLEVVRTHAQGVHQARELALRLYDGYSPQDGIRRPLEGRARAELPQALRRITEDPVLRGSLGRLVERGQQQAARLKSAPLRAAYVEAFGAWEDGAGHEALVRRLDVAHREKNRYFANRIAQTELARAHQEQVAAEIMADERLSVVEVRINPAHPKTDICDLHARANLWGLGPGLYPKAKAPKPPYHPFCWCRLRPRPSLDGRFAAEIPGAAAAHLRAMGLAQAGQVMGSRERAERVLNGADALVVVNEGKDALYKTRPIGG